jgi:uncharacterized phiE125 gp8 family phage protein
MSLQLLAPPAAEPVSLAEAKTYLKLDTADDDALIQTLITAARARAEWHTGRAFVTQRWRHYRDDWPFGDVFEIPLPPLISVEELAVTDRAGVRTVLDAAAYRVDPVAEPGRIVVAARPGSIRSHDGIAIAFTAGYGEAAAVPAPVKQAILAIVADLHTHRGDDDSPVGRKGQALLAPYRILQL